MKLIVGLGNPGRRYEGTRHNVGFEAVDLLASRHGLTWAAAPRGIDALSCRWNLGPASASGPSLAESRDGAAIVAKPLTFMNRSGEAIAGLLQFYKIEVTALLVVVDEIQLRAGRIRLRPSGSAGGHNGLKSVIQSLGTEEFPRLRIGVGRGDAQRDLADHVLSRVEPAERPVVAEAIGRAADAAEVFIDDGIMAAMNRFNGREDVET
jgi:PTH1 family peptidyl-tRNA hydrolase